MSVQNTMPSMLDMGEHGSNLGFVLALASVAAAFILPLVMRIRKSK